MLMSKSVFILGLRGIPGVQGGIETHVEHLAPLLVKNSCNVTVLARSNYQPDVVNNQFKGVQIKKLWSPRSKGLESIIHTFIGVLYAAIKRPDILHIHAVGPALMVPLARLLGLKVVITHHGPDYDRQKWGWFAKNILKLGEFFGARFSNKVIVISKTIQNIVKTKHDVDSILIPNGVAVQEVVTTDSALRKYDLKKEQYVLIVSRLVPEKRHFDLIDAFEKAKLFGWKLVIVGSSDHPDEYSKAIMERASESEDIIATGFLSGVMLQEIFNHAGVFVLPSSHEGLPIALLEALSYGLPVIASDIASNLEVDLNIGEFFPLGDISALENLLIKYTSREVSALDRDSIKEGVRHKYNWDIISKETIQVYESIF